MVYTVWTVNDGLSGNLWKPPKTDRGGFWQVSEFFINKNLRKPAGNLPDTATASFWRFLDTPSLTDHTID